MTRWHNPLAAFARALPLAALAVLVAAGARPAAAGVQVSLRPVSATVSPGAEFDVTLEVTAAGSAFNYFASTVAYDTTALTFVPAMPLSGQQGCLMTGLCSTACGNTFHQFAATHDSLVIKNGLLCPSGSLTGPGVLYRLRFRASNTPQVTTVGLLEARFYNAGLIVSPVATEDAQVGIGVALDAGAPPPPAGLSVRAEPNPARGRVTFAVASDRAGERRVEIHDLAGRLVRRLGAGRSDPGPERIAWDGADGTGARVRPGVYLVTVRVAGSVARTRVAVVE